jgi:hypothetical protein
VKATRRPWKAVRTILAAGCFAPVLIVTDTPPKTFRLRPAEGIAGFMGRFNRIPFESPCFFAFSWPFGNDREKPGKLRFRRYLLCR